MAMTDNKLKLNYESIVGMLHVVAAKYSEQIKIYPEYVLVPDEIAIDYDNVLIWYAKDLYSNGVISGEVLLMLEELGNMFMMLKASPDETKCEWSLFALENNEKWENIRNKAKSILIELNEETENVKIINDSVYIKLD